MIGFCKCDICGSMYHPDENKYYDGLIGLKLLRRNQNDWIL